MGTCVKYTFFAILGLPIFPLLCNRVNIRSSKSSIGPFESSETVYKNFGTEKWDIGELLCIYMEKYGIALTLISFMVIIVDLLGLS